MGSRRAVGHLHKAVEARGGADHLRVGANGPGDRHRAEGANADRTRIIGKSTVARLSLPLAAATKNSAAPGTAMALVAQQQVQAHAGRLPARREAADRNAAHHRQAIAPDLGRGTMQDLGEDKRRGRQIGVEAGAGKGAAEM